MSHNLNISFLKKPQNLELNEKFSRPAETEASPYAGYQLAYEVKKLMYALTFFAKITFFLYRPSFCPFSFSYRLLFSVNDLKKKILTMINGF